MNLSVHFVRGACWTLAALYFTCGFLLAQHAGGPAAVVALGWCGVGGVLLTLGWSLNATTTQGALSRPYLRVRNSAMSRRKRASEGRSTSVVGMGPG